MNFNSWIFRGWNHRSQNQRAVASGNDNFVANSVQAIAAVCTIFQKTHQSRFYHFCRSSFEEWIINAFRSQWSYRCWTFIVTRWQTRRRPTNFRHCTLVPNQWQLCFFQWTKCETCPLWPPKNNRSNCHVLRQDSQFRWRKLDTQNKSNDKKTLTYYPPSHFL